MGTLQRFSATWRINRCTPWNGTRREPQAGIGLRRSRVHLVDVVGHLLETTPYEVTSLDALTYAGNLDNLEGVMSHGRLSFVHGDIRDAALMRRVVAETDVIVNAAAESHVEKSIAEGASEFVTTNVEGTQILLDAMRASPNRALHPHLLERGVWDGRG